MNGMVFVVLAKWSKVIKDSLQSCPDHLGSNSTHSYCFVRWLKPTGLTGQGHRSDRCRPVVLAGLDRSDRLVAPIWRCCPVSALLFALCISCHTHHGFYFVAHTCCTPLILRYRGSSHALSSKFVLLAFEAKSLRFNSKHKLRGSSSYI
jgi:hypothetical protein